MRYKTEKKQNYLMYSFDEVGSINKPAFVVPNSLEENDSYQTNKELQIRITFTSVPMSFLFRDKWSALDTDTLTFTKTKFDKKKTMTEKRNLLSKLVTVSANDKKRLANMALQAATLVEEEDVDDDDDAENIREDDELDMIRKALGDGDEL